MPTPNASKNLWVMDGCTRQKCKSYHRPKVQVQIIFGNPSNGIMSANTDNPNFGTRKINYVTVRYKLQPNMMMALVGVG